MTDAVRNNLPVLIRKGRLQKETGLSYWQIQRLVEAGLLKTQRIGTEDYITRKSYLFYSKTYG